MSESEGTVHFMVHVKEESGMGSSGYLTVNMGAVLVTDEGKIRNPSRSFRSEPTAKWADFSVAAQLDADTSTEWYGRRIQYKEVFAMELQDAEIMVKNLRDMHRKLDKLDAKFGTATDFAAFMARVADAAGCGERPFIRLTKESPGFGYDSNEYRYMDTDNLRYHLAEKVRAWREKHGITAAS